VTIRISPPEKLGITVIRPNRRNPHKKFSDGDPGK
jgi:hypothetical protein